jgi:hypothetical protein
MKKINAAAIITSVGKLLPETGGADDGELG